MNKMLEELKKLKDVYSETKEFDVGPQLKVKVKILTSEEETEVHSYAMNYEQGLAYLYSVKRETLCKSIIFLNGKEIPETIEVGGEKIKRHIWLRENVVCGWSQMLIDQVWTKYADLILSIEEKIGKDVIDENKKRT